MTADLAFECLVVSQDLAIRKVVGRSLRKMCVSTSHCLTAAKAFETIRRGHTDLLVIDSDGEGSVELLNDIRNGGKWRTPTTVVISAANAVPAGVQLLVRKPLTPESCARSMRDAYSQMLLDYRRYVRRAVMLSVVATRDDGQDVSVTISNISDGGIGLDTKAELVAGEVLTLRVTLPSAPREILIHARVLWTRQDGRAGCTFMRIPPIDLIILHEWLKAKSPVKPLTTNL